MRTVNIPFEEYCLRSKHDMYVFAQLLLDVGFPELSFDWDFQDEIDWKTKVLPAIPKTLPTEIHFGFNSPYDTTSLFLGDTIFLHRATRTFIIKRKGA